MEITVRPKAYSYIRMSTERQLSGDSLRRQLQETRKYAALHNLDLDESLRDIGVSAYTGENVESGALGKFLQLVKSNQIAQGSYLIIESLDRLSRKNVLEALPPFLSILKAGIIIVSLKDEQVYSQKSIEGNPYQLMGSLVVMIRANEESETKSKRIKEAMTKMREAAMRGESRYNINLPSWIDGSKGARGEITYKLNHHAATVKMIYELAAEGLGQMEICRILHRENTPVFKNAKTGWHQSAVSHLLNYPAVIGTYQPKEHRNGKYFDAGPPQKNFFPAAIDEDLYLRAMKAKRNRPHRGRKGEAFTNLFQGMVTCGVCNGSMTLYFGRKVQQKYLRCYNRMRTFKRYGEEKKQHQCTNGKGINYDRLETAMLDSVSEFRLHEIFKVREDTGDLNVIARRLIDIEAEFKDLDKQSASLIEEISKSPKNLRHLFHKQLEANSEKQKQLEAEQLDLEAQRAGILTANKAKMDIEAEISEERASWSTLSKEDLYRSRSRVHFAYKRFIQMMTFDPETQEVMVVIANGLRVYKIRNGKLTDSFDAFAAGFIDDKPGSMQPHHFASDLHNHSDIADRMEVIRAVFEAKSNASLPNPNNPRLNDPDVRV